MKSAKECTSCGKLTKAKSGVCGRCKVQRAIEQADAWMRAQAVSPEVETRNDEARAILQYVVHVQDSGALRDEALAELTSLIEQRIAGRPT